MTRWFFITTCCESMNYNKKKKKIIYIDILFNIQDKNNIQNY